MKSKLSTALTGVFALFVGATVGANASPYVMTIEQVGSDVVATGDGNIDLAGLPFFSSPPGGSSFIFPNSAAVAVGNSSNVSIYVSFTHTGVSGPLSFGTGGIANANSSSGGWVRVEDNAFEFDIGVPFGYISDAALGVSMATYDNATIASLGATPGTYLWTWGTGADQSFTLDIVDPTPLPAALPLFATGLGGLGLLGWRRKRQAASLAKQCTSRSRKNWSTSSPLSS